MQLHYASIPICEYQRYAILVFGPDVLEGLAPKHRLLSVDTRINQPWKKCTDYDWEFHSSNRDECNCFTWVIFNEK